jgi:hypothetical protein
MSLDVYLYEDAPFASEVCIACVAGDVTHKHRGDPLHQSNITHNCTGMAHEADIYTPLWFPAMLPNAPYAAAIHAAKIAEDYHGDQGVYALEAATKTYARDLIHPITQGLAAMQADPARFKRLEPANRWGTYMAFTAWITEYLKACLEYPDATVIVHR